MLQREQAHDISHQLYLASVGQEQDHWNKPRVPIAAKLMANLETAGATYRTMVAIKFKDFLKETSGHLFASFFFHLFKKNLELSTRLLLRYGEEVRGAYAYR
jgi:hypothetical protein